MVMNHAAARPRVVIDATCEDKHRHIRVYHSHIKMSWHTCWEHIHVSTMGQAKTGSSAALTQSLHGPPTPPLIHRSRSLWLGIARVSSTSVAVDGAKETGPCSCCTSTPSTTSSAGAGVVPAIRTMTRVPWMRVMTGGLGTPHTRPFAA